MIRNSIVIIYIILGSFISHAQKIGTFQLELPLVAQGIAVPVHVSLDQVTFVNDSSLALVEIQGNKKTPVPFQTIQGSSRTLHWMVKSGGKSGEKHTYELMQGNSGKFDEIRLVDQDGALTFVSENRNLLRYQFQTLYPPAGIDTAYKRSGFIHPLWSPNGQVLTRIQAPDHYHHYGIWNPWTEVLFEGDSVDFWNLARKQGTVRFAKSLSVTNGPVFSEFKVLHEHVVFKKKEGEKVALNETQTVRIYRPDHQDYYIADITSELNCATPSPVLLLKYRYGGLGWRTTEQWDKNNSEVITSEGKTRKDADGTAARWCIVQGAVDNDYAGAIMMSFPTNYNHPEPLRIWPATPENRGDMFANFSPTKNMSWLLQPGKSYVLKYRLIVFNGHMTKEKAESAWQYFAKPPKVILK